jgi:hypothetical protein
VSRDFDSNVRVFEQRRSHGVQDRVRILSQSGSTGLEIDPLKNQRAPFPLPCDELALLDHKQDGASARIDGMAWCGVRAAIVVIRYAISVAVQTRFAPAIIHLRPWWCAWALVNRVQHSVSVTVLGAASLANRSSKRSAGAYVQSIEHSVSVTVHGTSPNVHLSTCRGIGTLVQSVKHPVRVSV